MSFALLFPLGLAALAALALPLLLHLLRRRELRSAEFAALRWIHVEAAPRRRLRVERPWLLLLRLLLLGLLALLLAQPVLRRGEAQVPAVLVAPGVELAAARAQRAPPGAAWRWLAPGFPPLEASPPPAGDFWSLLRELDAGLPSGARPLLIVPRQIAGLDGERPRLAHAFDWRVLDGATPLAPAAAAPRLRLELRAPAADPWSRHVFEALVAAWNVADPDCCELAVESIDAALPDRTAWLVWADDPVPARVWRWIEAGGSALVVGEGMQGPAADGALWRDRDGRALAARELRGAGRLLRLAGPLRPESLPELLEADFPARVRAMLAPPPAPNLADAAQARPRIGSVPRGEAAAAGDAVPLDPWLTLAIALLFLFERLLATARQGRSG